MSKFSLDQFLQACGASGPLHLTVEHWFLPNGRSINGRGLTPDVPVSLPNQTAMFDVVQPSRGYAGDAQLNRALQLLGSG